MDDTTAVESRLTRIEERLRALEERVAPGQVEPAVTPGVATPPSTTAARAHAPAASGPPSASPFGIDTAAALKWTGVGLVVLAAAFLMNLAIDRGWITPAVRVAGGYGIGTALLVAGFAVRSRRPGFGSTLAAACLTVLAITTVAGNQVLEVIAFAPAFAIMTAVTGLAFALSYLWRAPGLAVLGVIGGLTTPLIITATGGEPAAASDPTALVSYTLLLLVAVTALYLRLGWRTLVWTAGAGSTFVLALAISLAELPRYRGVLVLGVAAAATAFWPIPVARALLATRMPRLLLDPEAHGLERALSPILRHTAHHLGLVTPLVSLALASAAAELDATGSGWLSIGLAGAGACLAFLVSPHDRDLAFAQGVGSSAMSSVGLILLLDGPALLIALTAQMVALHVLGGHLDSRPFRAAGHLLAWFVLTPLLWIRFGLVAAGVTGLDAVDAVADLATLAAFALVAYLPGTGRRTPYGVAAYMGLLGWSWELFAPLDNGQALISAAWTALGVTLLLAGRRLHHPAVHNGGLATLAITVTKLFTVDLADVDPFLRVLLFLGVGSVLLIVGYLTRSGDGEPGRRGGDETDDARVTAGPIPPDQA